MSRRGNTLEDIGQKAIEASLASTTWRKLRSIHCETSGRCAAILPRRGWCEPCRQRREAYENYRRAKNTLLVAIRSYRRRTET